MTLPYLAGGQEWLYPSAGDAHPPIHTKVLILTRGGVAVIGTWAQDDLGWLPLPKRNKDKESAQRIHNPEDFRDSPEAEYRRQQSASESEEPKPHGITGL